MSIKMRVFYETGDGSITDAAGENSTVVFKVFDDDKEVGRLEIDGNDLPSENQHRAYLYGINKLLTDRTSDQKDKVVKLDEMQVVFDLLCSGEWAKERVVGAVIVSAEVEALAELMSLSIVDTQRSLAAYDKETRKKILANPKVVEAGKVLREKRATTLAKDLAEFIS